MKINNAIKSKNINGVLRDFIKNPGEGLYQRTVKSGFWVFALRITERGLSIVRLIVLARILSPNDFGLMGIALLAMSVLETFSQTGFTQALIQRKEKTEEYLDVAWTFMLLRNLALFAILFWGAPYIATFFEAPKATPIMRVIGLSLLFGGAGGIGGFANIGILYFRKELEFNKQFIYGITGALADFVVAVSAALIYKSVWALVFGLLAGNIVRFFMSYLIHPYRPHLNFDFDKAHELFGFGKWILGSSILVFLLTQGDDIFLGKVLGATALGLYQMAYRISNLPATEITHVISQVTFPAYSKLQDRLPQLRQAYLQTLQVTAFAAFPLAGGIIFFASDFTRIFLGEQWLSIVLAMQILVAYGLSRSLVANTGSLFQAMGRPELSTKLQFLKLLLLAMIIYPLTKYGNIPGTALAVAVSGILVDIYVFSVVYRTIHCSIRDLAKSILPPAFVTASTLILLETTERATRVSVPNIALFVSFILLAIVLYLVLTCVVAKLGRRFGIQSGLYARIWPWIIFSKHHVKRKLVTHLEKLGGPDLIEDLRYARARLQRGKHTWQMVWGKIVKNRINMEKNKKRSNRYLEIGPGNERIPGFETLNITGGKNVDYVLDAARPLPFDNDAFDLIYASHVLEHVPWYKTEEVLKEWVRILKPGGQLEVWVPDGLKACTVLLEAELGSRTTIPDEWALLNPRKDPFLWVNGRLIYGSRSDYPSWHRAIFTPRYLKELFVRVGLKDVREMDRSEVRGYDHGWINLGVKGTKP